MYVGLATVAAATWWFLYDAEGPQVTFYQLVSKGQLGSPLGLSRRSNSQPNLEFQGKGVQNPMGAQRMSLPVPTPTPTSST